MGVGRNIEGIFGVKNGLKKPKNEKKTEKKKKNKKINYKTRWGCIDSNLRYMLKYFINQLMKGLYPRISHPLGFFDMEGNLGRNLQNFSKTKTKTKKKQKKK